MSVMYEALLHETPIYKKKKKGITNIKDRRKTIKSAVIKNKQSLAK